VRQGARAEEVDALEEQLTAARARAELARSNLGRITQLHEMGAVASQERDRADEAQRSADAEVAAAQARLEGASSGRPEDVRDASAGVLGAQARLEQARATLERLTIRAPIHATVLDVDNRVGEQVEPNADTPMMVIGDLRTLRVRVDVDERDVGAVRTGAPAVITSDSYPGRFFDGEVVDIGEWITEKRVFTDDPTTRLDVKVLEVLVELREREGIVPGMRVTGYIASPVEPASQELARR
jgi:HlyD family secretion protein